jgi:inner membrane transporter RhtA
MLFASLLIVPFGIMGNGFSNLTPTFLSLGSTCPLVQCHTLEMKALGQLPARTFSILMSLEQQLYLCADLLAEHLAFNEIAVVLWLASVGSTLTTQSQT